MKTADLTRGGRGRDEETTVAPARRRPGRPSLSNEELLDRALDLFLEKGFAGTSIDAITATAGMAKRTVYARYGDKTRLFKAALSRAIDDWVVPIERLRAQESDDLERTLCQIGEILVANVLSPAGLRLMRLTNAESVRAPEISVENVQRGTAPTLEYLTDLFQRRLGLEEGEAQRAGAAYLNLVVAGPANGAAWGLAIDPDEIARQTRFAVAVFLRGVSPRADAVPAQAARIGHLLEEVEERLAQAKDRLLEARRLVREPEGN